MQNGFDENFVIEAKIKIGIPGRNLYSQTLYCYPELKDKARNKYSCGRIIESAYEPESNPFVEANAGLSLLSWFKNIFRS